MMTPEMQSRAKHALGSEIYCLLSAVCRSRLLGGISPAFKQRGMWGISLMSGPGRHGCRYRKVETDGNGDLK